MDLEKPFASKAVIVLTSLAFILLTAPVVAFSQETLVQENSKDLKVKYLDGDNDALLFNLKYNNDSGNDFKLMVLGESGEVLFQNNYSGKKFKKNFRLPRLTDTDGVTFLVRSVKSNVQLVCKVQVANKVAEELSGNPIY